MGLKGTTRPKKWCVEMLDDLGLYIAQLSATFCRDLREVEVDVALAASKAEGHDMSLTDLDDEELGEIFAGFLWDVRLLVRAAVLQAVPGGFDPLTSYCSFPVRFFLGTAPSGV